MRDIHSYRFAYQHKQKSISLNLWSHNALVQALLQLVMDRKLRDPNDTFRENFVRLVKETVLGHTGMATQEFPVSVIYIMLNHRSSQNYFTNQENLDDWKHLHDHPDFVGSFNGFGISCWNFSPYTIVSDKQSVVEIRLENIKSVQTEEQYIESMQRAVQAVIHYVSLHNPDEGYTTKAITLPIFMHDELLQVVLYEIENFNTTVAPLMGGNKVRLVYGDIDTPYDRMSYHIQGR